MILFVGLGNPTNQYQNTRHNFGFMVLDELIKCHETTSISKPKFKGELFKAGSFLFLKPTTYMNLSGESVVAVSEFYKPEKIIVLHDDLDIPLGSVRFKNGGSSGGHNGLKSIDEHIGNEYDRVRLGIGKPIIKQMVVKYVLENFTHEEFECVEKVKLHVKNALEEYKTKPLDDVIAKYTCKKGIC